MSGPKRKNQAAPANPRGLDSGGAKPRKCDYPIGRGRPPVHTQWQPGQSGNPKGRRKGRRNVKTELREIAVKMITVRDGERERQVSLLGANVLAHGVKGAKGDVRSAGLFLNHAYRMGLLDEAEVIGRAVRDSRDGGAVLISESKSCPSDRLFDNLELQLLSREELTELARLAEIIDLGGDVTALSTADFERVKHIVNKGRGKDIILQ